MLLILNSPSIMLLAKITEFFVINHLCSVLSCCAWHNANSASEASETVDLPSPSTNNFLLTYNLTVNLLNQEIIAIEELNAVCNNLRILKLEPLRYATFLDNLDIPSLEIAFLADLNDNDIKPRLTDLKNSLEPLLTSDFLSTHQSPPVSPLSDITEAQLLSEIITLLSWVIGNPAAGVSDNFIKLLYLKMGDLQATELTQFSPSIVRAGLLDLDLNAFKERLLQAEEESRIFIIQGLIENLTELYTKTTQIAPPLNPLTRQPTDTNRF